VQPEPRARCVKDVFCSVCEKNFYFSISFSSFSLLTATGFASEFDSKKKKTRLFLLLFLPLPFSCPPLRIHALSSTLLEFSLHSASRSRSSSKAPAALARGKERERREGGIEIDGLFFFSDEKSEGEISHFFLLLSSSFQKHSPLFGLPLSFSPLISLSLARASSSRLSLTLLSRLSLPKRWSPLRWRWHACRRQRRRRRRCVASRGIAPRPG
jgi:hypothetical protein